MEWLVACDQHQDLTRTRTQVYPGLQGEMPGKRREKTGFPAGAEKISGRLSNCSLFSHY